jgi:hypothetical protein
METKIDLIYRKLEEFISKYYTFKFYKGLILFTTVLLGLVLMESLIEYVHYLSVSTRTILFYCTIFVLLFLFIFYIVLPVLALVRLRKPLSYKLANSILSNYFPEIKDKLINTLELQDILSNTSGSKELVVASINNRIDKLSVVPFKDAVDYKVLRRNVLYFAGSVLILLIIFAFNRSVFTEGTIRLVRYSTYYEPPSPFTFILDENKLFCERNSDHLIELEIVGDYIPNQVYISISGNSFLMQNTKVSGRYSYLLRSVNNSFDFNFIADKIRSKDFKLNVLPAPLLSNIQIRVNPPAYTAIEPFLVTNSGDCTVPSGSVLEWSLKTNHVEFARFYFPNDTVSVDFKENPIKIKRQIIQNTNYSFELGNTYFIKNDKLNYKIDVIDDLFPDIQVLQAEDSLLNGAFYFVLDLKDDYGFHNLQLVKKLVKESNSEEFVYEKISINPSLRNQELLFYHNFNQTGDLANLDYIEYYFEVRDNDAVNKYKITRSTSKLFRVLSREEIRKTIQDADKSANAAMDKSKKLTDDIKKEIEEFKRRELSNELTEWDKKNFLKNITEKQKDLEKFVEEVIRQNQKGNQLTEQFYEEQKNILEKQKQIQELLDQILDDELKKLLEEIQKLSEQFTPQEFDRLKDKIDYSYQNLEKKLDRSLELLKRYQVEENVMKISEDLKDLSQREKNLSQEKESLKKSEELLQKQEKINDEFNQLKKEFEETIEKNEELKSPYQMNEFEKEMEQIQEKPRQIAKRNTKFTRQ